MSPGKLFIISAPSGAGKTSLVKQLTLETLDLVVAISHTTRPMRPGEVEGKDYYFVDTESFTCLLEKQGFLEYAKVYDNYYGTARAQVEDNLKQGYDVILEIDWQGAQQVKALQPDSVSVFILPPSIEILQTRLQGRGQDSQEVIARRMREAITEMSHYQEFDYLIVNDNFQQALVELQSIITTYRLQKNRQEQHLKSLLTNLFT